MREFTKAELIVIRRVAMSVKGLRDKEGKLDEKIQELSAKKVAIAHTIELFEAPIKEMSGGFTSTEILSGGGEAGEEVKAVEGAQVADEERTPKDAVRANTEAIDDARFVPGEIRTQQAVAEDAPWN